jgi:hypothetical protein
MEVAEVKPKQKRTRKKKLIIKSSSSLSQTIKKSLKNSPPKSPPKSPEKTKKAREKKPKEAKTKKDKIKPEPIKEKKDKPVKEKKDKPVKEKKQQTKKRKLIIASSTTSEIIPLENKNENKTDLNISQQISKMPVKIRLNEKFIDIMEQLSNIMLK